MSNRLVTRPTLAVKVLGQCQLRIRLNRSLSLNCKRYFWSNQPVRSTICCSVVIHGLITYIWSVWWRRQRQFCSRLNRSWVGVITITPKTFSICSIISNLAAPFAMRQFTTVLWQTGRSRVCDAGSDGVEMPPILWSVERNVHNPLIFACLRFIFRSLLTNVTPRKTWKALIVGVVFNQRRDVTSLAFLVRKKKLIPVNKNRPICRPFPFLKIGCALDVFLLLPVQTLVLTEEI